MVTHDTLWNKDGEIMDNAVIPDVDIPNFDKPEATLNDVCLYVSMQYHKDEDAVLRNFPEKGLTTTFAKDTETDTFSISVCKGDKLIAQSHDHPYCDLSNNIMDVAIGEMGKFGDLTVGKGTLKDILKKEKTAEIEKD